MSLTRSLQNAHDWGSTGVKKLKDMALSITDNFSETPVGLDILTRLGTLESQMQRTMSNRVYTLPADTALASSGATELFTGVFLDFRPGGLPPQYLVEGDIFYITQGDHTLSTHLDIPQDIEGSIELHKVLPDGDSLFGQGPLLPTYALNTSVAPVVVRARFKTLITLSDNSTTEFSVRLTNANGTAYAGSWVRVSDNREMFITG